jgi:hypothetical protein
LESSISGSFDIELSEDEKRLCAYDIQEELLHALDKYPQDFQKWIKDQYKKLRINGFEQGVLKVRLSLAPDNGKEFIHELYL